MSLKKLEPTSNNSVIAETLIELYDAMQVLKQTLELKLFSLITLFNKHSKETTTEVITSAKELEKELVAYYQKLRTIFDQTRINISSLSDGLPTQFGVKIAKGSCFYLYARNIINCILEQNGLPHELQEISTLIQSVYVDLPSHFHGCNKSELHFGSCLTLILQHFVSCPPKPGTPENKAFTETLATYLNFTDNIKYEPLKMTSLLFLFTLEENPKIQPYYEIAYSTPEERENYYYSKIDSYIQSRLEGTNNKVLHLFAKGTKFVRQLSQLKQKMQTAQNPTEASHNGKSPFSTSVANVNIKNPQAIYDFLMHHPILIESQTAIDTFKEINQTGFPFRWDYIFQTNTLMAETSSVFIRCLAIAEETVKKILAELRKDIHPTKLYYAYLRLSKKLTELLIDIEGIKNTLTNSDSQNLAHQHQKEMLDKEIKCYETSQEESERKLKSLEEEETANSKSKKLFHKILKDREMQSAYQEEKNQLGKTSFAPTIGTKKLALIEQAEGLITRFAFKEALQLYQQFVEQTDDSLSIEAVNAVLSIADTQKRLSQDGKISLETKSFLLKAALSNYQQTQRLADQQRNNTQVSHLHPQYEALFEIATLSCHELQEIITTQSLQVSFQRQIIQKRMASKVLPTIYEHKIPLPTLFQSICNTLKSVSLSPLVVGGYVRDFYLKETPHDIDAVILDRSCKLSGNGLIYRLVDILKQEHKELKIELRSLKYHIICIEHLNTIIELSTLKESKVAPPESCSSSNDILYQLLYEDAARRGLTEDALYYDPERQHVIDFFGGVKHIQAEKLHSIVEPNVTFEEDSARILRTSRSIVRRLAQQPNLYYSPKIVTAMQKYADKIKTLQQDKCTSEIKKLFFRGSALSAWQLLFKIDLAKHLFLLPTDSDNLFKHSLLVSLLLANLDQRVRNKKPYDEAFVFATLLWGYYHEQLATTLKEKGNGVVAKVEKLADELFSPGKLIFHLSATIVQKIKLIWRFYFSMNNILPSQEVGFNYSQFRLVRAFSKLISQSTTMAPNAIVYQTESKSSFFKDQRFEWVAKNIFKQHQLHFQRNEDRFIISLPETNTFTTFNDQQFALKQLKQHLQIILGKFAIHYELHPRKIILRSDSMYKQRAIISLLNFFREQTVENKNHIIIQ